MRYSKIRVFGICVVIVAAIIYSVTCVAVDDSRKPSVEVRTKDFLKTATIIGELGYPIGTEVEIVGYCEPDQMEWWPLKLHVFEIDGKPLKGEILFSVNAVTPAWPEDKPVKIEDENIFRFKGFESGYFSGLPLPKKIEPGYAPPSNCAFCYVPTIRYLKAEKIEDKDIKEKVQKLIVERHKGQQKKKAE
jgi:hypothetical protein